MMRHGDQVRTLRDARFGGVRYGTPLLAGVLTLAVPLLAGCPKKAEEKPAAPVEKKAEKPVETKTATTAATPTTGTSDAECIAPWSTDGAVEKREIAGKTYELQGTRLKETSTDPDDQVVIGTLANLKEDTAENLKNIGAILDFFKAEKADAIVVDGDIGDTAAQIANVLEPIAATGLPTFVIIGNQEKKSEFNGGVEKVAAKHPNVFNLSKTRLALLDDVALVSMPGYYNKEYILVENGCHYKAQDVEALKPIIRAAAEKPVVVISHGPPLQKGPEALDYTSEGANVGDPELLKALLETGVKFGIFANIREAGGHATNLDGTLVVGEGKPSPELFLNPGGADAVGWKMNDRTQSTGMAAVLTVKGRQGSFKVWRRPAQ